MTIRGGNVANEGGRIGCVVRASIALSRELSRNATEPETATGVSHRIGARRNERRGTGLEAALRRDGKFLNVLLSGKALRGFLSRWVAWRFR